MSDKAQVVVIPPELVAAQRQVDEAFRAVCAWTEAETETDSIEDRWAAVHRAAEAAHALRAPLVAAHTSWTVTQELSKAMHQDCGCR